MKTSVDQNSAGVLSLWHCILTRYTVSANKDAEEKTHAMIDIYRHMKHLRLAIHRVGNPDFISIPEIAKPFNSIVSGMPEEKWIEELRSFMREVVTMQDILKDIKCSTLENDKQPKNLICLLTLWYWLAAWSSLDQLENGSAKDEFIQAIEAQDKTLGLILVGTSPIQLKEQQELQILLFSKLLQMLESDPQLWTGVLNRFINTMLPITETPEILVTLPLQLSLVNANYTPFIGFWSPLEDVIDVVKNAAVSVYDGVKKAADTVVDEVVEVGKVVVKGVEDLAEVTNQLVEEGVKDLTDVTNKVIEGVKDFGKTVDEEVTELARTVGKGMLSMVEQAEELRKELEKLRRAREN